MNDRRRALAAALCGAVAVPAFGLPGALPVPLLTLLLSVLPIASLAGLLYLLPTLRPRQAAAIGYAWGLGFFLAGVSWVYVSLAQFSGLPAPVAAMATAVFCAFLALYPALATFTYAWLNSRSLPANVGERPLAISLFAALWVGTEWVRGTLFTGFPWLGIGYAQMPPSPLAGYASVVGVYGVGFISVLLAGLTVTTARTLQKTTGPRLRTVLPALACISTLLGFGAVLRAMDWTTPVGAPLPVRLFQGNVPQDVKWQPEHLTRSVETYLGLLNGLNRDEGVPGTAGEPVLHVFPETAIPLLFDQIPDDLLRALSRRGPTLLGGAVRTPEGGYLNAAIALPRDTAQADGAYAKHHLVPFGEFSPPGFAWFFRALRIPMADFTSGAKGQRPLMMAGARIAPNICYEDLFGEELLPALRGPEGATLLVNLSNTAWFGDSLAQPQHLQIGRMRALETGRVMLRATNSGMTAMIYPNGMVGALLAPFTTGVLSVDAQPHSGLTPYGRWGNALILAIALVIVVYYGRKFR